MKRLSLYCGYSRQPDPKRNAYLINFLEQTCNIHSLTLNANEDFLLSTAFSEDVYSTIIQYVNRSKLRHLNIAIENMHPVKMVLETLVCKNLFSIEFRFGSGSVRPEEITAYARTLMPCCSMSYNDESVSIWMDQRVTTSLSCENV